MAVDYKSGDKAAYFGLKDSLEHAKDKAQQLDETKAVENIEITLQILEEKYEEDN